VTRRFTVRGVLGIALCLFAARLGAASVKIWVSDTAADFSTGEARGISVAPTEAFCSAARLVKVEGHLGARALRRGHGEGGSALTSRRATPERSCA
jgi:hypothetical protein